MSYERSNFDFTSLARDGGRNPDNFYRHECHPLGSLYEAESGCTPDFDGMTDPEHLMRVFGLQQEFGEKAAGPDGVHYRDLGRTEVAAAMRDLSRRLREAAWEPGPARTTSIDKKSGNGTRPLRLRSIFTAMVSKVLHDTMQSFWDNRLLDGCCAYRPGRGPHRMLAEMLWTMKTTDCWVVAQADIKDAFENVAVEEVMRLHRELLTCDRLIGVIETLLRTDIEGQRERTRGNAREGTHARERTRGIDQGSAYSVHCLNARLHEIHDVHIRDDVPGWWRYSDDLTYLCATVFSHRPSRLDVRGRSGPRNIRKMLGVDAPQTGSRIPAGHRYIGQTAAVHRSDYSANSCAPPIAFQNGYVFRWAFTVGNDPGLDDISDS